MAGSTILEAATTETSGDRLLGLRTLGVTVVVARNHHNVAKCLFVHLFDAVLLALDPWKLSADRVHECLEEPGKEGEVTRVAFGTVPVYIFCKNYCKLTPYCTHLGLLV